MLTFLFCISTLLPCIYSRTGNHHHKHQHHQHKSSSIALPPSPDSHIPDDLSPSISPAPSPFSDNIFNVRSFGAVGDGVADDTEAFKTAWVSACEASPAVVLVPAGFTFMIQSIIFTGPCQNGIVLQVEGVIMPPDGPDSWPANIHRKQWLVFYKADGLILHGGGLIDGRGEKWWNLPCKPHKGANGTTLPGPCDSPVALRFFSSSNITLHGMKIINSPQFHVRFDNCKNITVDSVSITSPAHSPNTDGIHIENSITASIHNSIISNGDDCVSIGAGTFNVDINNVTCGPSHGISIGSLGRQNTHACVSNITVKNAVIKNSDNGVRIKTWQGGSGTVSSVKFQYIHMDNVRNPIIIDQYYCLSKECANQTKAVSVSNIDYTNIKGTYDVRSPAVHFGCSDSRPCTNITVSEIELLPANGVSIADPFCWNVYGAMDTITIPPLFCILDGLPRTIMDDDAEKC
ncbi:polygalacturonase At1g48100-like [Dioscorea cayenensis subsp. rotundata]|uniref:Polygalacturonase At1g48100-like n=1 Tax=Dioscorea cayennensis subsp. rotundata TaxID=55577 RepID=A0AB40BRA1_DIOCR|nr:polygalacturonase At1g48100-like [Dioscorea cayenensis subsp. rotundata]